MKCEICNKDYIEDNFEKIDDSEPAYWTDPRFAKNTSITAPVIFCSVFCSFEYYKKIRQ